jgi:hypothetical protein
MQDFKNEGKKKEYKALEWEIFKYNLNVTIMKERKEYLKNTLLVDKRCDEDLSLPPDLVEKYIVNGTNLKCPKGTDSERGAWCLGQCKINLASKEPVTILNPITDVITITSLTK